MRSFGSIQTVDMDKCTRDDYVATKVADLTALNMSMVLIFFWHFSAWKSDPYRPDAYNLFFMGLIGEATSVLILFTLLMLELYDQKTCRKILLEYPVISFMLMVGNGGFSCRYAGRVLFG